LSVGVSLSVAAISCGRPASPLVQTLPSAAVSDGFGSISGSVTDVTGAPVLNAFVHIAGPARGIVLTGDDGSYSFGNAPTGRYLVWASGRNYSPVAAGQTHPFEPHDDIAVKAGVDARVDFRLHEGGTVMGRVIDERGRALEGAQVRLLREVSTEGGSTLEPIDHFLPAVSSVDGRFQFFGVPEGAVVVGAEHEAVRVLADGTTASYPREWQLNAQSPISQAVEAGKTTEIVVELQPHLIRRISGRVRTHGAAAGAIRAGTVRLVRVERPLTLAVGQVSQLGEFELSAAVPDGKFTIVATVSTGPERGQVEKGAIELKIERGRNSYRSNIDSYSGGEIRGRLNGLPVPPGTVVHAEPLESDGGLAGSLSVKVTPAGEFAIRPAFGRVRLVFEFPGRSDIRVARVSNKSGDIPKGEFTVPVGQIVDGIIVHAVAHTGSVNGAIGADVANGTLVLCVALDDQGNVTREYRTTRVESGRFRFDGLAEGHYRIAVAPGFDPSHVFRPKYLERLAGRGSRVRVQKNMVAVTIGDTGSRNSQ
jgi:hypothetical protein